MATGYLRPFCFSLGIVLFAFLFALLSFAMFVHWQTALVELVGIIIFAAWAFRRWKRHHMPGKYNDHNWKPRQEPSRW